jgi:hypothetical protein
MPAERCAYAQNRELYLLSELWRCWCVCVSAFCSQACGAARAHAGQLPRRMLVPPLRHQLGTSHKGSARALLPRCRCACASARRSSLWADQGHDFRLTGLPIAWARLMQRIHQSACLWEHGAHHATACINQRCIGRVTCLVLHQKCKHGPSAACYAWNLRCSQMVY